MCPSAAEISGEEAILLIPGAVSAAKGVLRAQGHGACRVIAQYRRQASCCATGVERTEPLNPRKDCFSKAGRFRRPEVSFTTSAEDRGCPNYSRAVFSSGTCKETYRVYSNKFVTFCQPKASLLSGKGRPDDNRWRLPYAMSQAAMPLLYWR